MKCSIPLLLLFVISSSLVNCDKETPHSNNEEVKVEVVQKSEYCASKARPGDMVWIHYNATLLDGAQFDSSMNREGPFNFQLGAGHVIQGLDRAMIGMCTMEKRKFTIPSHLAYGEKGVRDVIPPGATLVLDVELFGVSSYPPKNNLFKFMDLNSDNKISEDEMVADSIQELFRMMEDGMHKLPSQVFDHNKIIAKERFKSEDQDGDGFISLDEFHGTKVDVDFVVATDSYIVLSRADDGEEVISSTAATEEPRDEL